MNENEVLFVLSTDIFFDNYPSKSSELKNIELIPKIYDIIKDNMTSSRNPELTWLISDEEKILNNFFEIRKSFSNNYDEIGMHCLISAKFEIENSSLEKIDSHIKQSLEKFSYYGITPVSNRILGCGSSNQILQSLSNNGFKVDSSAIPNRKRNNKIKFDWVGTSFEPYHPSKDNYKISTDKIENQLNILEVPLSTITTKTSYDQFFCERYLDLSFHNKIISKEISKLINSREIIVSILHPSSFIGSSNDELISDKFENFVNNLKSIIDTCDKFNKKLRFVTLSDIVKYY